MVRPSESNRTGTPMTLDDLRELGVRGLLIEARGELQEMREPAMPARLLH